MKIIDHDPNEGKPVEFPDAAWRDFKEKQLGRPAHWTDAMPIVVIVAVLYFMRVGWPF